MPKKPEGIITRGTTAPNRLRRIDRWLLAQPVVRRPGLVVDLGFGSSPITCLEMARRLRQANPQLRVIGLEIDPQRLQKARQIWSALPPEQAAGVSFAGGGFEVPVSEPPLLIRAANVLRQYSASEVQEIWSRLQERLSEDGMLIDATCSESGQVASWVNLSKTGPKTLVISLKLDGLDSPAKAAERLPKALINRNVPGENIHRFLSELTQAWQLNSSWKTFGGRQRWIKTCQSMKEAGWRIHGRSNRWRLGEIEVDWEQVA